MMGIPTFRYSLGDDASKAQTPVRGSVNIITAFFYLFFVVGLMVVCYRGRDCATAMMWALACSVSGAALGFLFSVPKIVQPDGGKVVVTSSTDSDGYRQQVNTNLTDISDWLTKIIVGLGLINLRSMPGGIKSIAVAMASGIGSNAVADVSFAYAVIVYFVVLGFLCGYLETRMYLAAALGDADRRAISGKALDVAVDKIMASTDENHPPARKDLLDAASSVKREADKLDKAAVREQIYALAREYEAIRARMPYGDARTRQMAVCVAKMQALAMVACEMLPDLLYSASPGVRLAAIAILQVNPSAEYLDWLADRMAGEKNFVRYQAAVALLYAAKVLSDKHEQSVRSAIQTARELYEKSVRKDRAIERILDEAEKASKAGSTTAAA